MRIVELRNSIRPAKTARSVLVWFEGSRQPERSGVPDHVGPQDVARTIEDKSGQKVRAWRFADDGPEIQPRPRAAL